MLQVEYWQNVSEQARQFVRRCLTVDPTNRPTSEELLADPWLKSAQEQPEDMGVMTPRGGTADLLPNVKKAFDAKKTCKSLAFLCACMKYLLIRSLMVTVRKAVLGMIAMNRLQDGSSDSKAAAAKAEKARVEGELRQYKLESEEVRTVSPVRS